MTSRGQVARQLAKEGSDEMTQFAPFEASRTISTALPYRGEQTKPPQVEINDASYLGQPKVLFRKLTASSGDARGSDKKSPRGSPQPFAESVTPRGDGRGQASRRVRVHVVGDQYERDERGASRRVVNPAIGRVTKSLVLNRIGTLGKDQVRVVKCVNIHNTSMGATCTIKGAYLIMLQLFLSHMYKCITPVPMCV